MVQGSRSLGAGDVLDVSDSGQAKSNDFDSFNVHTSHDHPPLARHRQTLTWRQRFHKTAKRMFQHRYLMQYFDRDTLYKTKASRSVRSDELFLDLVIVGGLAALGHELRENFEEWKDIEKFILLFYALYSSWRSVVFLWNLWDVKGDVIDKLSIYLTFLFLIGVTLGANNAFDDSVRPFVSVCAFLATAVPGIANVYWALREPLLKNNANLVNPAALSFSLNVISVLPYLAAAFVPSEQATRILFWIPLGVQAVLLHSANQAFRVLHRNRPGYTRVALSIEHIVEKYEVLTMIVLGESVLGLLFEAEKFVSNINAEVGDLYASAIPPTLMLYCFQTLYVNIDNSIGKGDVHAIRHDSFRGLLWTDLHALYHLALILFATGLGISIRDIALPVGTGTSDISGAEENFELIGDLLRDESETVVEKLEEEFTKEARWFFSVGWGASIILSAAMAMMHYSGPRSASKKYRLIARVIVAVAAMVGLPFTDLSAGRYLAVYASILFAITSVEYVIVQMDRMGCLQPGRLIIRSLRDSVVSYVEEEEDYSNESVTADVDETKSVEQLLDESNADDNLKKALSERMQMHHRARLFPFRTVDVTMEYSRRTDGI